MQGQHLPMTVQEMKARGWSQLDVVLVTGDAYVDHPSFPAALLGRVLESAGFQVGLIARPDTTDPESIKALGMPRLFFGVTAGALDSMVANYTALKKVRSNDDYAPGGAAGGPNGRPDRALTVYCNMIRQVYGKSTFIVGGGIEASLRRFGHYDYWSDKIRRSILMDSGADVLVYGQGEGPIVEIAKLLSALLDENGDLRSARKQGLPADPILQVTALRSVPGLVYRTSKSETPPADSVALPDYEKITKHPEAFVEAQKLFESSCGQVQHQAVGGMRVIANAPWPPLTSKELDAIYELPFTRNPHPSYGHVSIPAMEQVRFSITSHRGCFGGCAFCAISAHQGKTIVSRSEASVLEEVNSMAKHRDFRGVINDVGGPSANMFGSHCMKAEPCNKTSCLFPKPCRFLQPDQRRYENLLYQVSQHPKVKKVFVTTGLRIDLAVASPSLIKALAVEHTSGHLKIAPEHVTPKVLRIMKKPAAEALLEFREEFDRQSRRSGKKQYILPYFMAGHPGTTMADMVEVAMFLRENNLRVEQCQIFTPTPGTASSVMYATGLEPATGKPVFVEKNPRMLRLQKALILSHLPENKAMVREALQIAKMTDLIPRLLPHKEKRRRIIS